MSDTHHHLLNSQSSLIHVIDPYGGLLEELMKLDVFTTRDRGRVVCKDTPDDMVSTILEIVKRKSDCCFDKFLQALHITNQDHVVFAFTGEGGNFTRFSFVLLLKNICNANPYTLL